VGEAERGGGAVGEEMRFDLDSVEERRLKGVGSCLLNPSSISLLGVIGGLISKGRCKEASFSWGCEKCKSK
jgi:hypothetical protein